MDFNSVLDLLLKSNIDSGEISKLITRASGMDLTNEENQRELIKEGCKLTGRTLTPELEDKIIMILKEKGISNDLFNYLK